MLLVAAAWAAPAFAESACEANPFGVVASIERIEPSGEVLTIVRRNGARYTARLFDCLLPGDALHFTGRATAVDLYEAGAIHRVLAVDSPYRVESSLSARLQAIGESLAFWVRISPRETGAASIRPRTKATSTLKVSSPLGKATGEPTLSLLEGSSTLVLAWSADSAGVQWRAEMTRAGHPSPALQGHWQESAEGVVAVFDLPPLHIGEQWRVRILDDLGETVLQWDLRVAPAKDVPVPSELSAPWDKLSPPARVAWAVRVLREGPPGWRAQALTELYGQRKESWLAGHLFYRAVNNTLDSR